MAVVSGVGLLTLAALVPHAGAVPVLDQDNTLATGVADGVWEHQQVAQTFTVGLAGILATVDLQVSRAFGIPSDAMLLFDIRATAAGIPLEDDGTILAAVSIPASMVASTFGGFTTVDVSAFHIAVGVGDVLAIVLRSDLSDSFLAWPWMATNSRISSYGGGATFFRDSDPNGFPPTWFSGAEFGNARDSGFRTFVEPATARVPEPTSFALLAAAVASLTVTRSLRHRS